MSDAIRAIGDGILGLTRDDFLARPGVRDAVTGALCVTGEAPSQLLEVNDGAGRLITDPRKIVGPRNQLVHGYGVIGHEITWRVATDYLPPLRRELEAVVGPDPTA